MKKRMLFILTIVSLIVFFTGCDTKETTEETIHTAKQQLVLDDVIDETSLPSEIAGFPITWTSNNTQIIDGNKINKPAYDTEVMLSAAINDGDKVTVKIFNVTIKGSNEVLDSYITMIHAAKTEIVIESEYESNISLPTTINNVTITWSSNKLEYLSNNGIVTRPLFEEGDQAITLTATFEYEGYTETVSYDTVILKRSSGPTQDELDLEYIEQLADEYIFNYDHVEGDIFISNSYGIADITWTSSDESVLSTSGDVTRPDYETGDVIISLTATFIYRNAVVSKTYYVTVVALPSNDYTVYYEGVEGLTGTALKAFLHDLIDDHEKYSYSFLWTALAETDRDPNNPNNVILLYTGRSQSAEAHGGNADDWNREHVWAKSHGDFGTAIGPGTDMHHIRPTDASVNSTRSNLDFDNGGNAVYDGGTLTENLRDSNSWEPRDEVKGDVARMIFYMAVRYEGDDGYPDLEINDNVNNSGPYMGRISILLEWHLQDPPDEFEMNRNNQIEFFQGNRNPFIDYPEFAEMIFGN